MKRILLLALACALAAPLFATGEAEPATGQQITTAILDRHRHGHARSHL